MGARNADSANRNLKIILIVMVAGMLAVTAFSWDGGYSSEVVGTAQTAADAGALGAAQYLSRTGANSEDGLVAAINEIVEANGIPDSDSKGGNDVNDNVAAYYMSENGDRISGCSDVGACGTVPESAQYIKVVVVHDYSPFIVRLLGIEGLGIAAEAMAPLSGESA